MDHGHDRHLLTRLFRGNTTSNYIAAFVTILAIGSIFVPFFIPRVVPEGVSPEIMSMLIAVVTLIFGDRFIDIARRREDNKTIDEVIETIRSSIPISYVGTYMEALEYFKGRIKFAESVKDTIIAYKLSPKELDIYFFDSEDADSVQKMVCAHVNRGKIYRAVISSKVVENIYKNGVPTEIEEKHRHLFHIKTTQTEFPAMNFTILEYGMGEENREVLFGWGHHIHDDVGHVFSARDRRIVDTFERLFQSLLYEAEDWPKGGEATATVELHAVTGTSDGGHKGDATKGQAAAE